MPTEFFIHKMSEHMETARIIRWLVKEGDAVSQYQVIMEVETDKAVVDMEAPAAGIIRGIRADAVDGAEVKVGETIAYIAAPGEVIPSLAEPVPEYQPGEPQSAAGAAVPKPAQADGAVRATPLARRVAKDLGVDLAKVKGSGPNGIIRDEDVRAFLAQPVEHPVAAPPDITPPTSIAGEFLELTPTQASTGRRMLLSQQTAPQFALTVEADMTNLLWLQEALMERVTTETGHKLSLTALFVKVVAEALKAHPRANAAFEDGKIRPFPQVNVGVAVGTDNGLVVPVIHAADRCSLVDISRKLLAFQEKAKTMHFTQGDLEGGSFTLSNLGMYGIMQFNAILNPPQSAILAVGKVVKRAVELAGGSIGLRPAINLTLTVDHRVLDGLQGARFLASVQQMIEKPYFML